MGPVLDANGLSFSLDTVLQYHFEAGSFPGADGKYRTQVGEANPPDDVPYWTWWPVLTDYIAPNNHPTELARYDLEGALAGAATTRWSSTNPTTKNAPTASTAARWFPAMACDTVPNTRGPSTADDFPTMA